MFVNNEVIHHLIIYILYKMYQNLRMNVLYFLIIIYNNLMK